ncbi:hypothetical protein GAGA_1605 [Paraglaciecola agarilytica NO2]|uniref:Uncharacterized protein n=1 Tax=Paraglaciecola agarilytica NO2 TaxID=1125747 RepID=A0ABQ0I546_9ALTE|nr:hypothetical protein GAGA_1605 [Paraglaciecola agarilytica NO2]
MIYCVNYFFLSKKLSILKLFKLIKAGKFVVKMESIKVVITGEGSFILLSTVK